MLLRTAYVRSGFELPRDNGQARFFESANDYLANMERLTRENPASSQVSSALLHTAYEPFREMRSATSSIGRADAKLPIHMHMSEQVAEMTACILRVCMYADRIVASGETAGAEFTAVHAIHISESEIAMMAKGCEHLRLSHDGKKFR